MIYSAELIDKDGFVVAVFEANEMYTHAVSGRVESVTSWDGDDKSPLNKEFFADLSVKWDGCSHFWFYGEDYPYEKESYYHLCGVDSFIGFMRMLAFCYEIMVEQLGFDKILEKEEYKKLKTMNLFDGYTINYIMKEEE